MKISIQNIFIFLFVTTGLFLSVSSAWGWLPPELSLDHLNLYENSQKINDNSVIVKLAHKNEEVVQREKGSVVIYVDKKVCGNGNCVVEQIYESPQKLVFYKTDNPNLICDFQIWQDLHKDKTLVTQEKLYNNYLNEHINSSLYSIQIELGIPKDQKIRGAEGAPSIKGVAVPGGGGGIIGHDRYFNIDTRTGSVNERKLMSYLSIFKVPYVAMPAVLATLIIVLGFIIFFVVKYIKRRRI